MFGASGLVATIVTFHPSILLASLIGAALLSVPAALLLYAAKVRHWRALLACLFVGATLITHVSLSRWANVGAFDVEVVKIWGADERPAATTPAPTPLP